MKKKKLKRDQIIRLCIFLGLGLLAVLFVLPYIWMIMNSFKSTKEILIHPKNFIPLEFTWAGYIKVLTESPFFDWLRNSLFITITNTTIILFVSAIVGYVFAKFDFKFKKILFMIMLATMMIPEQTTMIPRFLLLDQLGLYNHIGALIFPTFVSAFGIYLCKQFCDEIPREIIESAKLDGAGDLTIFIRIVVPMIRPALGALAIFTFLVHWNDYLNPLIMISEVKKMTLPLALSFFANQHMADLSAQMAASALIMIPVTIVFLIFQKQFIKGIAMTGMK
jgi:multiple sugar transport system permease protein